MATNLSVRLDDDIERKLDELVERVMQVTSIRVRRSDIVRSAIERMYEEDLER